MQGVTRKLSNRVMREIERAGYVDLDEIAERLQLPFLQVVANAMSLIREGRLNPPEDMEFVATGDREAAERWGQENLPSIVRVQVRASIARGDHPSVTIGVVSSLEQRH